MKPNHMQNNTIKITAHLEDRRGYFHIAMSWRDRNGNRGRKSVSTGLPVKGNKKRAEEVMRQVRREHQELLALMPEPSEILFADFMEQWLDIIKPKIKLTTYGGYCMNVKSAIAPYFREKGTLLRELTAEDINDFYTKQLTRLKATSVHKFHANISKALKYAVKKGMIPYSVMDKVDRPKAERFVGKFLKQSEAVELFEAVKGHKLELGVILGAFYGLRRAEIIGLRWESIDFDANSITIEHTVTVANIDGKNVIVADDTTKTKASFRTLPLVPHFKAKLHAVKDEQEKYRKLCGKSYNKLESKYIYTDQLGNRIKPDYLTDAFPKFMVKNGFRRLRFHDLRHSCASLLLANKVPLKHIQDWLGHSDFSITANTYAHLEFNSKLSSAEAMTWIDRTSLAQHTEEASSTQKIVDIRPQENASLPDMISNLMASGVPLEIVQLWLKQDDLKSSTNLVEHFKNFAQTQGIEYNKNCQLTLL